MYKLNIRSEEQTITLSNGYTAELKYNVFDKYWYYNLFDIQQTPVFYGMALKPDTCATRDLTRNENIPLLVMLDEVPDSKEAYNPYVEIGGRLGLYEA